MLANLENKYESKAVKEITLSTIADEVEISYAQKTKQTQNAIRIEAENEIYKAAITNTKEEILGKKLNWSDVKEGAFSM